MKDVLLRPRDVVRISNMKISRLRLPDYVKTWHQKSCRRCSTIIFLHSTNQIIDLWRCGCRCCRQILNSLKMKNARAKRAKILFFIFKYANSWGACCRRRELIGHVKKRIQYKSAIMPKSPRNFYSLIQILNFIKVSIHLCLLNVKLSFSI